MAERDVPGNVTPIGRAHEMRREKIYKHNPIGHDLQNVLQVELDASTATPEVVVKTKRNRLPIRILRGMNSFRKEFNKRNPDF